ncbi:MAG: DUF1499 domain-containing protein [Thiohalomonadales bacterium]
MKAMLIIVTTIILAGVILFFVLAYKSKSGSAPGLVNGSLTKCPAKPLCVCSEHSDDVSHYIDPIPLPTKTTFDALTLVKVILVDMGGTLQSESENYLAFSFSSRIFGFVDDIEIRLDPTQRLIHLRSASRIGRSDLGVNRSRIELFKQKWQLNIPQH